MKTDMESRKAVMTL